MALTYRLTSQSGTCLANIAEVTLIVVAIAIALARAPAALSGGVANVVDGAGRHGDYLAPEDHAEACESSVSSRGLLCGQLR